MSPSFTLERIEAGGELLPCVMRGPANGVPLLVLPALFEEMNRTRRLIALVTARLAGMGVRSCLPDLPGTGDHEVGVEAMDWDRWRAALAALAERFGKPHLFAVRGGAVLADAVAGRSLYRLAPPSAGIKPLRDLLRARLAADREAGLPTTLADLDAALARGEPVEAAGYTLPPALAESMRAAPLPAPALPTRTVGTASARGVDAAIAGPPVWLRADGGEIAGFADAIADDLGTWIARRDTAGERP